MRDCTMTEAGHMFDDTALVQKGLDHHQRGRLAEAAALYEEVLRKRPGHAEANHLLGLVEHQSGRREDALRHLSRAVEAEPDNAGYHSNLGVVLQSMGRLEEAAESYRHALSLDAGIAAVHNNLGVVLHGLGRHDEAAAAYRHALALEPRYAEAYANLGLTQQALGEREQAEGSLRKAIALRPGYATAHGTLGSVLRELGRLEEALESYEKAVAYKPDFAEAHYNLGRLQHDIGRHEDAVASHRRALAIRESAATHFALALALAQLDRHDEAAAALRRAAEIDPRHGRARSEYWRTRGHGCDWRDLEALHREIREVVTGYDAESGASPVAPFPILGMLDDPELHLRAARNRAEALTRRVRADAAGPIQRVGPGGRSGGKIRLAYLSSDFHDHVTAYLTAELFELHDKERFEVHGISFGPRAADTPMRQRLEGAFAGFHDFEKASPREIAQAVADLGVDIAVDLKGHTQAARTMIFAYRPAPIQVQYLGYPGSMGADFIDYVIADRIVIPEAERRHYRERIAYLPHSYQVNDRRRPLPASMPSRRACGLPEAGFVFAGFNASYKITPEVFSVWMRLLQQVEGSVLWLLEGSSWATRNLRAEAAARGVDAERIIFAGQLDLELHLARIGNADLFLDTLPYNAHTTASDALWVGLPVVTVPGRSFAARVAASLLNAVGLPELVTGSLEEYERLALELAGAPERLAALRAKLQQNRRTAPLFDTPAFTRHIEAAYQRMWELHMAGKGPETFRIEGF
jgi:protein O-GlcNAc transferase